MLAALIGHSALGERAAIVGTRDHSASRQPEVVEGHVAAGAARHRRGTFAEKIRCEAFPRGGRTSPPR